MKKATPLDIIQLKLDDLRKEYAITADMNDEKLFIILCEKYFYNDGTDRFDYGEAKSHIVDGANDGGVDAILNDADGNIIIIQSKFYKKVKLRKETIFEDIDKIIQTIRSIENFSTHKIKDDLVQSFLRARDNMLDDSNTRIVYFTSYNANTKEKKSIEKRIEEKFPNHYIEIKYATDIVDRIDCIDNAKECVERGELHIDDSNNHLRYNDAIIVNISAQSLWKLYKTNQNGLLGMNLRYYVKSATVDNGIKNTIEREPETFWYRNNGITIACEHWDIDGTKLNLHNFSIINGGQTTNRIAKYGVENDFFILCKVIKALGKNTEEQEQFILKVAEASNSQKPIKKEDLKANAPEQNKLKEALARAGINYITKRGSKKNKLYTEPYQEISMKGFGKLSLAARLRLPGTARNKGDAMFTKANYGLIYRTVNAPLMADVLRIDYYCDQFIKDVRKNVTIDLKLKKVVSLSHTHILACTSFLCELCRGVIQGSEIAPMLGNAEELRDFFRKNKNTTSNLVNNHFHAEEERSSFNDLFYLICTGIIMPAFEKAERLDKSIDPSNFLKSDDPFLTEMITDMHRDFCSPYSKSPLRLAVEKVCGTK